jgi:precorrin-8X/cobalt-precorrin-8 methylmutase
MAMGDHGIAWIAARGRKGGSPIAVAIIHALLMLTASEPRSAPAAAGAQ